MASQKLGHLVAAYRQLAEGEKKKDVAVTKVKDRVEKRTEAKKKLDAAQRGFEHADRGVQAAGWDSTNTDEIIETAQAKIDKVLKTLVPSTPDTTAEDTNQDVAVEEGGDAQSGATET